MTHVCHSLHLFARINTLVKICVMSGKIILCALMSLMYFIKKTAKGGKLLPIFLLLHGRQTPVAARRRPYLKRCPPGENAAAS
jgi:hypothetical protein